MYYQHNKDKATENCTKCLSPISCLSWEGPSGAQPKGLSTSCCHSLAPGYHLLPQTVYKFSFWENQRAEQNQSPDQAGVKYQELCLSEQNLEGKKDAGKNRSRGKSNPSQPGEQWLRKGVDWHVVLEEKQTQELELSHSIEPEQS